MSDLQALATALVVVSASCLLGSTLAMHLILRQAGASYDFVASRGFGYLRRQYKGHCAAFGVRPNLWLLNVHRSSAIGVVIGGAFFALLFAGRSG